MASNTLQTISLISRDAAIVLGNTLDLAKRVNRSFDSDFGIKAAQIGQTINVRRPIRPTVRTGSVVDIQAINETYSPLSFTNPYGTDYALSSQELTFSVEDYFDKVAKPSVVAIASKVESAGQALIDSFYNAVGTPGTALTGTTGRTAITKALALLNKNDSPREDGRKTLLNDPDFNGVLADGNASLFNPMSEIAKIYTDGYQGRFSSFDVFMNQLVKAHTNGTYGGTPLINGTVAANDQWSATGSLVTDGWTATSTSLNPGDVFTIAGVYSVNPQTKDTLSSLQQFTVTTKSVTDGSGNSTLAISPAIITTGGFQNVSAAPADNAAITVLGASGTVSQQAFAFDKDAIMLAAKELMPFSVGMGKTTTDDQTGIPIRVQQMPDIRSNQEILRFDVMVAWGTLYSQLGVKIFTT
jgi:P22 coat protein - gene protein 5